ncbi:MAG: hypothetical protein LBB89_02915 [Treponema sp.]|jgi:hypothetical protein|nr:hypothetical protein [Treponema sp.]
MRDDVPPEEELPEEQRITPPEENPQEEEPQFEMSPDEATGFDGGPQTPGSFNRKRVLIVLCAFFAVVIGGGLIINTLKAPKKKSAVENEMSAGKEFNAKFVLVDGKIEFRFEEKK